MRLLTRLAAAAILGSGIALAHAGHDDVKVDRALKRYAGTITALGEPDAQGRIYSFRGTPVGPAATTPKAYAEGELRGWRLTFLAGQRFAAAFEVQANTDSEITVSAADGALNGIALRDVFVVEQIQIRP
jgi:hypothetical protein